MFWPNPGPDCPSPSLICTASRSSVSQAQLFGGIIRLSLQETTLKSDILDHLSRGDSSIPCLTSTTVSPATGREHSSGLSVDPYP